ncbi:MAG: hypothetical protein E2O39_07455 [Planctomycetota bacterium]|nr:MAG: hypothetical protein E2O39_07455 [Planctomycetota bacterium]
MDLAWIFTVAVVAALTLGPARQPARRLATVAATRSDQPGDLRQLKRDLRDPYPDKRQRAVKKLAKLGTRESWELVIRALEDSEPQVADEAQIALGAVTDARVLAGLLGREGLGARDEWVQRRVAEAFGRMSVDVDGARLARALAPREVAFSRALLWSLERLAWAGHLAGDRARIVREVEVCLRSNLDPALRASALSAVLAIDAERGAALAFEALGDRQADVRCAALLGLERLVDARTPSLARRHLADSAPAVRGAAIEILARAPTRAGLRAMVEQMADEPRTRLGWRMVACLQHATGMLYRYDPRPWRLYVAGLPADWAPGAPAPPRELGNRSIALAGMPLLSDRVTFLVDFSGSLWQQRVGELTRKEILDAKVRAALESLPEGTAFNLIPYTSRPIPWQAALVEAKRSTVSAAVRFFEDCKATGTGNVFDAVLLALSDPDVDTLVILTDGAPTGGRHWNLDLMVELLVEESRYRGVVFDSILIDASKQLQGKWQGLAERTHGRSHAIALAKAGTGAGR